MRAEQGFGPSALATPANAVTIGRLLATPLLFVVVLARPRSWPTLLIWTLLAGTDGADGFLARRQGTTRSGAFLDPLADKCLVLGAMAALVIRGRFWWLPVAVIAAREVAVSTYRWHVSRFGVTVPARPWAKVKTVVQDLSVGVALLPVAGGHPVVANTLLWMAAGLTVLTGAQYLLDGRRVARAV